MGGLQYLLYVGGQEMVIQRPFGKGTGRTGAAGPTRERGSRQRPGLPSQAIAAADGGLGQVQLEVQKKWRQWHLQEFPLRPVALNNSFSNATNGPTHSTKASTEQSRSIPRASII